MQVLRVSSSSRDGFFVCNHYLRRGESNKMLQYFQRNTNYLQFLVSVHRRFFFCKKLSKFNEHRYLLVLRKTHLLIQAYVYLVFKTF